LILIELPTNRVRRSTSAEFEIDIESDYTVAKIKERIQEKENVPPRQQTLLLDGKQMSDNKTASEYKLESGTTLQLIMAIMKIESEPLS
jgi:ubiquitin-like protein Nedd8